MSTGIMNTLNSWNPFGTVPDSMTHDDSTDVSQYKPDRSHHIDGPNKRGGGGGMASGSNVSEDAHVIDIEEMVRRWAWNGYEMTKTKEQARIPKEFINISINWKYVKFHYDTPDYNLSGFATATRTPERNIQPQTLFKTVFQNRTTSPQEYSFKTERSTRSSATICMEKGFTTGMDFSLGLKTPCEVLEANAGFSREIHVNNMEEDTIEEELTWGVDSQVKVPPNTETTAELVVTEAQASGAFALKAKFHGRVIVSFTNMKDNNSLITVIEGHMSEIMFREIERGLKGYRIERNRIVIAELRGKCKFKFGVEQKIRITEMPIQPDGD